MVKNLISNISIILFLSIYHQNLYASDIKNDAEKVTEKYPCFGLLYTDLLQLFNTNKKLPNSIILGLKQFDTTEDKIYESIKNQKKTTGESAEKMIYLSNFIADEIITRGICSKAHKAYAKDDHLHLYKLNQKYEENEFTKEFKSVLSNIVDSEIKRPNYLVFYSANDAKVSYLYEIYTITHMKKNKLNFASNQKIIRTQNPQTELGIKTALDFWNYLQSLDNPDLVEKKSKLTDCSEVFSTYMISASKTVLLYDFLTSPIESAIAAFLNRTAVRSINLEERLHQFFSFQKITLNPGRFQKYLDLFEEYGQKTSGRLQQIFIKDIEKDLVYLSEPFGFPSLIESKTQGEEYYGKINPQTVRTLENSYPDDQVRILCDPVKFSNPDLVKVVEHGWGNYSEEKRKTLTDKLKHMLNEDLDS